MKNFKKALSVLLVTVMLLSAAPLAGFIGLELPEWKLPDIDFNFSADAAGIVKSGSCGENLTWTLYRDGVLTIAGTGEMTNYSSFSSVPWDSNSSVIKVLSLSSSITNIGNYAFYGCSNLKTILVNDVEVIQPDEESSTLPEFPEEPDLPDEPEITTMPYEPVPTDPPATEEFNEESQTTAPAASYFAVAVTDPEATTAIPTTEAPTTETPVTDVPATEAPTPEAPTTEVPATEAPTTSQDPSFDLIDSDNRLPDSVTSIGDSAFSGCHSLTSVTIPDSVTSIGDSAFSYCTSLTSVTIPDSVTSIGESAFAHCRSLTSVTIPDSVTSIGWSAFEYCTLLTSVTIPDSVTSIGEHAFYYCTSLTGISVDADNTAYCSEDGVLFNKSKTELIQYPVGNARTSYTIPDSVTSIGDDAFYKCTSLTSVTIPDSVTSIGRYAFEYCTSLTSVTIPASVTSIGFAAFCDCTSLTDITVDADNTAYCSEDGVLFNKSKTELIQYPVGNARTSYTIPDSVTSIGYSAFRECTSLTSVTIGDSVTSIVDDTFRECTSLTSVTIGNSVTSIGWYAFYYCTSLTSVTIPDSVTSIGYSAFSGCPALTIRGYLDSYAQQYAESSDTPFIALNTDPFVNLSGSSVTPTAEFTVYGFATPLQAVSLYCEDAVIGTATAGANGRYTLTATLPAPEDGKTYTVIAKISVDGVDYESEPLQVTYNSDSATLNTLVFTHSYYTYTITSETLNFGAPIISINSGLPMYFTITLNGKTSDTLTVVSTKNGVRKTMPATYDAADGKWYASGWFDIANKSYVPGEITLEYDDGKVIEVPFKAKFIVDPSGYVYEAVKSNVVEDAVAIVQYKDENGNAAYWDADAYDQVNPQITKADGYFSWFVPEGEWQVKIVKDGYQTALSDWYTVPPEVTGLYIPLVTTKAAQTDYCNVFADYAEIKFSQYMQIDSINSTNITFGEYTGTWEAVDKEVSGTDENVYYATTFRFTPDTAFSGDITVNVANVMNYAGKSTSYTNTVTVTAPIENFTLSATALTIVTGAQATVELDAGAAAAGKTVSVQFDNEAVASAVKTVTLDENGKASLTVNGNAFGVTTATFALAGTSLTAECTVTVTAPIAVEPAFTLGDVDDNGKIEAADARLALRAAVKLDTLTEAQTQAADADKNGKLEAADARLILRAAVGLGTL